MQSAKLQLKISILRLLTSPFTFQFSPLTSKGFTLIETIVVLAIIMTIGSSVAFATSAFLAGNSLKNTTGQLVSVLRTAELNAMSGKQDSKWGVNLSSTSITLYSGNSYQTRNAAFDVVYEIPQTVSVATSDIVFEKVTGDTNSASIQISSGIDSITISVNEAGTVNIEY